MTRAQASAGLYPPARVAAAEALIEGEAVEQVWTAYGETHTRRGTVLGINYNYDVRVEWHYDSRPQLATPYFGLAFADHLTRKDQP